MANRNVLSDRYVTPEMNENFSETHNVLKEREFWIEIMKAQKEQGMNIPSGEIEKFERAKEDTDFALIRSIERETRHDVDARKKAFIKTADAGEFIHRGMTARDLTDNVEQIIYRDGSKIIFGRYVSVLHHLLQRADDYRDIIIAARTHHQAAQPTLLGRRMSMWAEELLLHLPDFERFIQGYPLRGIKGPVGTQFDMLTLLGDEYKVNRLERRVASKFGFSNILASPGQVYPRSLDFALLSYLARLSAACEDFATGMRLMAGYELVTEGFKEGQVGSTAMPHKMNTRSSERICSAAYLVKTYTAGGLFISGNQWEEGDVSCSMVRRVINPDAFYASDGLCETTLTVLNEMGVYPEIIGKEVDRYLPFLATTEILSKALKAGLGRETAHAIIKKYSVAEALKMRQQATDKNELAYHLSEDPIFEQHGITRDELEQILRDKKHFIGNARRQIQEVYNRAHEKVLGRYPSEAAYEPRPIL